MKMALSGWFLMERYTTSLSSGNNWLSADILFGHGQIRKSFCTLMRNMISSAFTNFVACLLLHYGTPGKRDFSPLATVWVKNRSFIQRRRRRLYLDRKLKRSQLVR